MMRRAIELRRCIEGVVPDVRHEASKPKRKGARQCPLPLCLEDDVFLSEEDWQAIGYYHNTLRHFKTCGKKLEGK